MGSGFLSFPLLGFRVQSALSQNPAVGSVRRDDGIS